MMRLYLDRNLVRFGSKESSLGFRLTSYVDGLSEDMFDKIKDWQNSLVDFVTDLNASQLQAESAKLIKDVHHGTEIEWDGWHCFIGIHNMHAHVLFIPIESRDTPYNETGWYTFSCSFAIDALRMHLAFSDRNSEEYSVYCEEITRQYQDVRLFLCCNVLTSRKALQCLAYAVALRLGNYRELQSDCLEYAKAVSRLATTLFATENEMQKSKLNLRMRKLDLQALDNLTVTNLRSEAISRRNPASRYPTQSALLSILTTQLSTLSLVIIVSLLTTFIAMVCYHFLVFH